MVCGNKVLCVHANCSVGERPGSKVVTPLNVCENKVLCVHANCSVGERPGSKVVTPLNANHAGELFVCRL